LGDVYLLGVGLSFRKVIELNLIHERRWELRRNIVYFFDSLNYAEYSAGGRNNEMSTTIRR
jgi:hypothetical protein